MCAGAGDALSVGARSALADMRGPGVPPPGWVGEQTHICLLSQFCLYMHGVCITMFLCKASLSHCI